MEDSKPCTLLVRHLPAVLSEAEKEEFLIHFGAIRVKLMGTRGPLKHTAFAKFSDHSSAEKAVLRLHQLEVLGCRLVVEFARKQHEDEVIAELPKSGVSRPEKKEIKQVEDEERNEKKKLLPEPEEGFKRWSLEYPRNPRLTYLYPPPTVSTLTNIANALASFPKFYVQVLHLMNKLNLPAPFGAVTTTPPLAPEADDVTRAPDKLQTEDMEYSSSEESEIEEGETERFVSNLPAVKRHSRQKPKQPQKKPRIFAQLEIPSVPLTGPVLKPSEVFEQADKPLHRQIQFNIATPHVLETVQQSSMKHVDSSPHAAQLERHLHQQVLDTQGKLGTPEKLLPSTQTQEVILEQTVEQIDEQTDVQTSGFGKIAPVAKPIPSEEISGPDVNYKVDPSRFVSRDELRRGRVAKEELRNFSVFKKYEAGEPTSRLYIKNLAKTTTEQDLVDIFGSYVNWTSDLETNMFDIRLMKEGRMKGQAFITLPSEHVAKQALSDVNAYVINGKPVVVQFARSAKAKDPAKSDDKK